MSESSTAIAVLVVSALGALAFFASFGGRAVAMAEIASALVFPGLIFLVIVAALALIRLLLALSES